MILNKIRKTISEYGLIKKGDKVLAAVSGGADSICLAHALISLQDALGITVYAAHVNHGIRGEEALRDEEFVRNFCSSSGIECYILRADAPAYAKEHSISEETAGRIIRYDYFKKICCAHGIDKIATAHNKNDNAETLLMNFMRGTTVKGLCGIPHMRGNIIRPLLDVSREEIEKYCADNCLSYVTDSTNNELIYTRNKIRNRLIPFIENEFNPNFISSVTANSVFMREDNEFLDKKAIEEYTAVVKNGGADIKRLLPLDNAIKRRVIRKMLTDTAGNEDISSVYINAVLGLLDKPSGASVDLQDGICASVEYGRLIIGKRKDTTPAFEYELTYDEDIYIPELSSHVRMTRTDIRKNDGAIYLSCADTAKITIRNKRAGDVFSPLGMSGSKKVKELFIDDKIPRHERGLVPIIEAGGKIAAVGRRVDKAFSFRESGIKIEIIPSQEVRN